MLLVFPHPDDESFTSGGTIAKYVQAGWTVELVCATRGEAGNRGPHRGLSDSELGKVREAELIEVSRILGISSVKFLVYKDGTLPKLLPGILEDVIYKELIQAQPDVIITFEPNGISNHPDHLKLTVSTTYAFQEYAKEKVKQAQNGTKAPEPKLYYACVPESVVMYLRSKRIFPATSFGKPFVGTPDKLITHVVDIKRFKRKKKEALLAHRTQEEDVNRFLSAPETAVLTKEYFILRMQGVHEVFMGKNDRVRDRL